MSEQRTDTPLPARRRLSPRTIGENAASVLIALGVVMLMQPLSLTLYSYSFIVTLIGTVLFIVGSKLPE
jgi:hypothetical protein